MCTSIQLCLNHYVTLPQNPDVKNIVQFMSFTACRLRSNRIYEFLILPGEPLLCSDFNCPGGASAVDSQLLEVLSDRGLLQVVN